MYFMDNKQRSLPHIHVKYQEHPDPQIETPKTQEALAV